MTTIKIEVEVSESSYKLGEAVKEMVKVTKDALADGFQAGQDVPVMIAGAFGPFTTAVSNMGKLGEESKENMDAFLKAWSIVGTDIAALFMKKPETVVTQ